MSTTVESLELKISSDSTQAAKGIESLTRSLEKLKNATKNLGLGGVSNDIKKVADATRKVSKENNTASASFATLNSRLRSVASGFKTVGKAIFSAIQKSSDYVENVNLFTVSMGQYADEAKAYAEEVGEAMGIDPGEWMRNQGVFMTLATGFGVAGDRAKVMSKNLTQLGYDLSSFFNISYEDAMEKLQSGLAGELEPLRRIGYDLSQAKLEAVALELGIDKAVSSMTQAEKAELRYYAIMTQVTTAHGDMARTLNAPANQLKVLKAQFEMAAREIGNVFIPALNAILPYVIAVVKVIRILASNIASLFGYEMPEVDYSGVKSMTDAAEGTSGAMDDATESAKKLKSYMLGFDELNVINPNEGDSDIADDALGGFDFKLPDYNMMEGLVESKVATIVEEMKEWLGITDDINTWAELFDTRFGTILKSAIAIGTAIATWKVTMTTMDAVSAISALMANPTATVIISATLAITGITISFLGMEDAINNGVDGFNFAEIVGGGLLGTGGAALLGSKIATWISTAFSSSAVDLAIHQAGINMGAGTIGATGAAMGAAVAAIIVGIPTYFVGIYDACVEGIDWLNGLLIGAGATAAGAGIGAIIGMLGGPIGAGIGALIGLAVGLVTDLVILIVQNWDSITSFFDELFNKKIPELWNSFTNWLKNLPETISKWFNDLWTPIKEYDWENLGYNIGQWLGNAIKNAWDFVTKKIPEWAKNTWKAIETSWKTFWEETWPTFWEETWPTFWKETLPKTIKDVLRWFWDVGEAIADGIVEGWNTLWGALGDFVDGIIRGFKEALGIHSPSTVFKEIGRYLVEGLLNGISETWEKISTFFSTTFEKLKTSFSTTWEKIKKTVTDVFDSMWTYIKKPINSILGGVESMVNGVIKGLNTMIEAMNKLSFDVPDWVPGIGGKTFGFNLKTINTISIPRLAEGGFPEQGQMFIAREAGAEMVGNIGRRTAVANNDQIVAGIAGGVAEANAEQNTLLREQNSLLRALLEKDSGVYLDGKNLTNSVEKYQRERGRVLITGGVL